MNSASMQKLRIIILFMAWHGMNIRGLPATHSVLHTFVEPHHVTKRRVADHSLRILLYYDQSVFRLDEQRFQLMNVSIILLHPHSVLTNIEIRDGFRLFVSLQLPSRLVCITDILDRFFSFILPLLDRDNLLLSTGKFSASWPSSVRKCDDPQVFVKNGKTHCINDCSERTMCGEVEVPVEHLDACRVCNATGQRCGVYPGSTPGEGIPDFDFVFYVSAIQTERCNKSLTVAYASHCQQESGLDSKSFHNLIVSGTKDDLGKIRSAIFSASRLIILNFESALDSELDLLGLALFKKYSQYHRNSLNWGTFSQWKVYYNRIAQNRPSLKSESRAVSRPLAVEKDAHIFPLHRKLLTAQTAQSAGLPETGHWNKFDHVNI
ncbi:hypothetical protein HUJ05_002864 [Dendroctonus ponderosae]|nr:hypothetical protein HUJ05_002864 [Dendroctonus ponderosae]